MECKKTYKTLISHRKIGVELEELQEDIARKSGLIALFSSYETKKLLEVSSIYIREYFSNQKCTVFPPSKENEHILTDSLK